MIKLLAPEETCVNLAGERRAPPPVWVDFDSMVG